MVLNVYIYLLCRYIMQIFPIFHNWAILFSEIIIFYDQLVIRLCVVQFGL